MDMASFQQRRSQIEHYFDRVAPQVWARLTSDAPVSGIRATVRAGRERMRATLLDWLPRDLIGARLLDAGCGTGALAVEAARRGAEVVAIDISPTLVSLARERAPASLASAMEGPRISFLAGDMLDPALGTFDHVVAMDSLIHYEPADVVRALACLSARTRRSMLFTHPPRTPLLAAMHTMGKLFPRSDRSPAIVPVQQERLWTLKQAEPALAAWRCARSLRIDSGFYISQAEELVHT
jgi:magnesium-protoporphyrin O-methyltransferase